MPSRRAIFHWMLTLANYKPPTSHLFLRVISQAQCLFQQGLGRWEKCATGQPAQWRVQRRESPSPFNSALGLCGLHWSGVMERRFGMLNAPRGQPRSSSDKIHKGKKNTHTLTITGRAFLIFCTLLLHHRYDRINMSDEDEERKSTYGEQSKSARQTTFSFCLRNR